MFAKEIINRVFVRPLVVVAVTLMLSACGSSIEGTYSGSAEVAAGFADVLLQVTFNSDTVMIKTSMSTMGRTVNQNAMESEYELDGNKIKVEHVEGMSNIWTLEDDGSISVPAQGAGIIKLTQENDARADSSTGKHDAVAEAEDSGFSFSAFIAGISSGFGNDISGDYGGKYLSDKEPGCGYYDKISFTSDGIILTSELNQRRIPATYTQDGNKITVTFSNSKGGFKGRFEGDNFIYRFPSDTEEFVCHKLQDSGDGRADHSSNQRESEDSGFSLSKFIAGIFAPNVEGVYVFTAPKESVKFTGLLTLKLDSGKAFLTMKQGSIQAEEQTGTYVVDENEVRIKGARGKNEIFILGDDGSLMPPPGFSAGPKFIRED